MNNLARTVLGIAAFTTLGCKNGGSGGPVTAPTPPGSPQPPTVNITSKGLPSLGVGAPGDQWGGDVSFNEQTGANTFALQLEQTGAQVTGQLSIVGPDGGGGPIAGVVSGSTFTFNFSVGNGGAGCGNTASGTATVATDTITGTFSGKRCNGSTYTNAKFTVSVPYPYRTSPYPVGGNWTMNPPAAAGGGQWNFTILEMSVDATRGNLSGSVAVVSSSLSLGAGTFSGSVQSSYPGPTTNAPMTVTFAGSCASTLTVSGFFNATNPFFNGGTHMGGTISGRTCNGDVPSTNINYVKQ